MKALESPSTTAHGHIQQIVFCICPHRNKSAYHQRLDFCTMQANTITPRNGALTMDSRREWACCTSLRSLRHTHIPRYTCT